MKDNVVALLVLAPFLSTKKMHHKYVGVMFAEKKKRREEALYFQHERTGEIKNSSVMCVAVQITF